MWQVVSRCVLDLLNAFCECYTTRRNSFWTSLTSSFWLSVSVFMRVIQRVGSGTDRLTGFNGHSSHRPEQRVDDWGAISQIVVVTSMFVLKLCSCRSLRQKLICNFDLMRHCPFRELSLQAQIEGTCPGFQIKGSGAELYLSMTMSCFTNCWEFGGRCHWTATDRNSKNQLRALLIVYCVLLLYCWTKSTIVEKVCANSANILFLKSSCIGTLNCPIHIMITTA